MTREQRRRHSTVGDPKPWSPGCAPRSRRRSGRWSAAAAARHRAARPARRADVRAAARRRRRARPATLDAATRSPNCSRAPPSGDDPARLRRPAPATRGSRARCAAISPAASTLVAARCPTAALRVVDYKTNWLGADDEALTAWHYRPAALDGGDDPRPLPAAGAVLHRGAAPLPALALPGYDPDAHLAGVLYLFLRGMVGAATPRVDGQPCGVFAWRPPAALIERCSATSSTEGPSDDVRSRDASTSTTPGWPSAQRVCCASSTMRACSTPPTSTSRTRLGAHRRRDRRGRAAGGRARRARAATRPRLRRPRRRARDGARPSSTTPVDVHDAAVAGRRVDGCRRSREPDRRGRATATPRPLRLEGTRLYLDRYWRQECSIADGLSARAVPRRQSTTACWPTVSTGSSASTRTTSSAPPPRPPSLARSRSSPAAPAPARPPPSRGSWSLLDEQAAARGPPVPRIALAAPTGKAAARLEEAVHGEARSIDVTGRDDAAPARPVGRHAPPPARLAPRQRSRFRHDRGNRLPYDVVIVDETSMVSLSLMARLSKPSRPDARLVLVGDPDQLASVEAGAVLGDIVGPAADTLRMPDRARARGSPACVGHQVAAGRAPAGRRGRRRHRRPRRVHRFGGAIAELAEAIRRGDVDAAIAVAATPAPTTCSGSRRRRRRPRPGRARRRARRCRARGRRDGRRRRPRRRRARRARRARPFRVLCAHRAAPYGVAAWTAEIERWLARRSTAHASDALVLGRPLLVTENDYALRLYNGDTGVVVARRRRRVCVRRSSAAADPSRSARPGSTPSTPSTR